MQTAITTKGGIGCGAKVVTQSELDDLISTSSLSQGCWYHVTDYQTISPIWNSNLEFSTGDEEEIFVLAISEDQISPTGYSITYGDRLDMKGNLQTFTGNFTLNESNGVITNPNFTYLGDGEFQINFPGTSTFDSYVSYEDDDNNVQGVLIDLGGGVYGFSVANYNYMYSEFNSVLTGNFSVSGNTITVPGFDLNLTSTSSVYFTIGTDVFTSANYGTDWEFVGGEIVILLPIDVEDIFENGIIELNFNYTDGTIFEDIDIANFISFYITFNYRHNVTIQSRITGRHTDGINFHVSEDYHSVLHRRFKLLAPDRTPGTYGIGSVFAHDGYVWIALRNTATTPGFGTNRAFVGTSGYDYTKRIIVYVGGLDYAINIDSSSYVDQLMFVGNDVVGDGYGNNSTISGDVIIRDSFYNTKVENISDYAFTAYSVLDSEIHNGDGYITNVKASKIIDTKIVSLLNMERSYMVQCSNIAIAGMVNVQEMNACSVIGAASYQDGSMSLSTRFMCPVSCNRNFLNNITGLQMGGTCTGNTVTGQISGCSLNSFVGNTVSGSITSCVNCSFTRNEVFNTVTGAQNFTYTDNLIKTNVQFNRSNGASSMTGCTLLGENWFRGTASSSLSITYDFRNIRSYAFWDYTSFIGTQPSSFTLNNVINRRGVQGWLVNSTGAVQMRDWDFQTVSATTFGSGGASFQINFCNFDGGISSCNFQGNINRLRTSEMQSCTIQANTNDVYVKSFLSGKTILSTYNNSVIERTNGTNHVVVQYDNSGALVTTTF